MEELAHLETPDGLFLERLEAFMQKCLLDVKAFSEREHRSYEETKRRVAEWHARQLFEKSNGGDMLTDDPQHARARQVLVEVSHTLESLNRLTGVHAFFLAVNPEASSDRGFLGGTVVGRSFWRGLRGGGEAGARAFRAHCARATSGTQCQEPLIALAPVPEPPSASTSSAPKSSPAIAVKNELYNLIRDSLRVTSGIRNAEMKWASHERLSAYGVYIVGWPDDVPKKNPSSLNVSQNKLLLNLVKAGTLKFVRSNDEVPSIDAIDDGEQSSEEDTNGLEAVMDEFVWADGDSSEHPLIPSNQIPGPSPSAAEVGRSTALPGATAEEDQYAGDPGPRKRARYGT